MRTRIFIFLHKADIAIENCSMVQWVKAVEEESDISGSPQYYLEVENTDADDPLGKFSPSMKKMTEKAMGATDYRLVGLDNESRDDDQTTRAFYILVPRNEFDKVDTPARFNQKAPVSFKKMHDHSYHKDELKMLKHLLARSMIIRANS